MDEQTKKIIDDIKFRGIELIIEEVRKEERERARKIIEEMDAGWGDITPGDMENLKQEALKKLNS